MKDKLTSKEIDVLSIISVFPDNVEVEAGG